MTSEPTTKRGSNDGECTAPIGCPSKDHVIDGDGLPAAAQEREIGEPLVANVSDLNRRYMNGLAADKNHSLFTYLFIAH